MLERLDVIEFLISKGTNNEAKDNEGGTALLEATCNGELRNAEFLVSK